MSSREYPGEFEQVVLLTVARLNGEAYGMAIREEIADRTGRDVGIGSVYSALDRMEAKGFVSSSLGDPTPERGGRAKRYYRLERAGVRARPPAREGLTHHRGGQVGDPEAPP